MGFSHSGITLLGSVCSYVDVTFINVLTYFFLFTGK